VSKTKDKSIRIGPLRVGSYCPPLIIAEVSANHNGSLDRALATITAAKKCGADAVKIQTYTADTMTIDCDLPDFRIKGGLWDGYKLYDLYKWAQTPYEWHPALFEHAKKFGITLFSTPFDETAVDLLKSLKTPAYKIASFELTDIPLIEYVAKTRKPMILSTGMATEQEIEEAVISARKSGCKELVLLHCISSYPTPIDQAHLRQISALAEKFKVPIGLSDHTLGTTAAVASVALGACVIEKHFTLSRADKGPDCEFSLEPQELKRLCQEVKEAWLALGSHGFSRQKAEEGSKVFRRSLHFIKNLPAGSVIQEKDIRRIRPGTGLHPKEFPNILAKSLQKPAYAGEAVSWDFFASKEIQKTRSANKKK
jgi:N-acetylneuraminate synthase